MTVVTLAVTAHLSCSKVLFEMVRFDGDGFSAFGASQNGRLGSAAGVRNTGFDGERHQGGPALFTRLNR
jgi:hypothetical protein